MANASKVNEQAKAADAAILAMQTGNTETTDPATQAGKEVAASTPNADAQQSGIPQTTEAPKNPETKNRDTELQDDPDKAWKDRFDLSERRYTILQGKYNAEVPRLTDELKQLKAQLQSVPNSSGDIATLNTEIAALKSQLAEAQQQPAINTPGLDQLKETYGEELVGGIAAMIRSEMGGVREEVQQVSTRVDEAHQASVKSEQDFTKDKLRALLAPKGIDFDLVNSDPLFADDFLNGTPPELYGISRGEAFGRAYNNGDLATVASFFEAYAKGHDQAQAGYAKPNLEEHVPHQPTAPVEPTGSESDVWTEQRRKEFYEGKRQGIYTQEEADRLEKQLFQAISENRVA